MKKRIDRLARAITPKNEWWIWREIGLDAQPLKAKQARRKHYRDIARAALEWIEKEKEL